MGGEKATESWFSSLWRISRGKASESEKATVGILAFEVVSLMSKIVKLWHCLSDREMLRLREEVANSIGVRNLVSEDDNYLMDLVLNEIIEDLVYIARAVARLGNRCSDPVFSRFELFLADPIHYDTEWLGWEFKGKKMEKKVRKMERFIAAMMQFSQEQEVLVELEQSLRRMRANPDTDKVKLLEFQQKVMWQRQEVKNLRDSSPWNRTYDYTVRVLLRSFFSILERVKLVFGTHHIGGNDDCKGVNSTLISRSHSFSALVHSSIYPSEKSAAISEKYRTGRKQREGRHSSFFLRGKNTRSKSENISHMGPFRGCMDGCNDSPLPLGHESEPVGGSMRITSIHQKETDIMKKPNMGPLHGNRIYFKLNQLYGKGKNRISVAPLNSLGAAALDLQYARVIILIEKLSQSPHLIGADARDDLYNMLPASIRSALRAKLKSYTRTLASFIYDSALLSQWSASLFQILDWLGPLAHNTVRWQSEQNIEKQPEVCGPNVLLVQTLYFADLAKTEAAIVELLVGLNYICRISREVDERGVCRPEFSGREAYGNMLVRRDEIGLSVG
ncbi:uncharacterized protein LOC116208051 [Punica granatum]|uniref:DUF668 domain-containing protein n=2 Tax=Punica granatum TaxID=22663 RepID=A0A218XCT5_PUNGR|nr:uncharacterized protein LOC116208051 [Punica granatum]OWM82489.1 hypothetical protein CDL15_Pgr002064 [Punica granatum]PKI72536.1 hypothetical protein CRG98_007058 [Punica granatum]